jgi:hypothetical protein
MLRRRKESSLLLNGCSALSFFLMFPHKKVTQFPRRESTSEGLIFPSVRFAAQTFFFPLKTEDFARSRTQDKEHSKTSENKQKKNIT